MNRLLDVYLGDRKAGVLAQDGSGVLNFYYVRDHLLSPDARAISFSMPLAEAPYPDHVARPFFSGLLPDEGARQRLAEALGLSAGNVFGLLAVVGAECAGALSLLHEGETPALAGDGGIELLTAPRLGKILGRLHERPLLGGEEGVRLSLAGAQDKLAVCIAGDAVGLAKGGRPTTHILKPLISSLPGTVENKMFCLRLARRLGFSVPAVSMRKVGAVPFLLVDRYDRVELNGGLVRLHQEDFCQALGVPPELKYEEGGGPGTERALDLIGRAAARPAADRLAFIRMLIFHYLIGNADAHAKNYALLYRERVPDLAPVYDALCTTVYPRLTKKLAMAIGGRSVPDTIQLRHWQTLVPSTRVAQGLLAKDLNDLAARVGTEADGLIEELEAEGVVHPILDAIRSVIETRATHILQTAERA